MSVIAYTLGIGNVLNGGTPKGQADGFDLQVLGKLTSTKNNQNNTMLQFIMAKIVDNKGLPEVTEGVKVFKSAVSIRDIDTSYVKTKTNDVKRLLDDAQSRFNEV